MLKPLLSKNDRVAYIVVGAFTIVLISVITLLEKVKLNVDLGFDPHWFARINAIINSAVSVILVAAVLAVKNRKLILHRSLMMTALVLSFLFLLSYVGNHLFTNPTYYPKDTGIWRTVYLVILSTHILLAGCILPFVLFTTYRALTADFTAHKKLARWTFPVWLYVSVTGVVVYWMISPYYN